MVGPFVGLHCFQITHVAHDGVLVHDAVGAEEVAAEAGAVEGDGDVVALEHGDVGGLGFALVFEPACVDGEELGLGDFGDHPGEFFLYELVGGDGAVVELFAVDGVLAGGFVAVHGGSEDAPADAVAGLGETAQSGFESGGAGQEVVGGDAAVGEGEAGGDGGSHGELSVEVRCGVAGGAFFDEEAADALVRAGPDDGDVGG